MHVLATVTEPWPVALSHGNGTRVVAFVALSYCVSDRIDFALNISRSYEENITFIRFQFQCSILRNYSTSGFFFSVQCSMYSLITERRTCSCIETLLEDQELFKNCCQPLNRIFRSKFGCLTFKHFNHVILLCVPHNRAKITASSFFC